MRAYVDFYVENEAKVAEEALFVGLTPEQKKTAQDELALDRRLTTMDNLTATQPQSGSRALAADRAVGPRREPAQRPPSLTTSARRPGEAVAKIVLRLAAWLTIVITVGIVIALIIPAIEFFRAGLDHRVLVRDKVGASVRQRVLRCHPAGDRDLLDHRDRLDHRRPDRARRGGPALGVRATAGCVRF